LTSRPDKATGYRLQATGYSEFLREGATEEAAGSTASNSRPLLFSSCLRTGLSRGARIPRWSSAPHTARPPPVAQTTLRNYYIPYLLLLPTCSSPCWAPNLSAHCRELDSATSPLFTSHATYRYTKAMLQSRRSNVTSMPILPSQKASKMTPLSPPRELADLAARRVGDFRRVNEHSWRVTLQHQEPTLRPRSGICHATPRRASVRVTRNCRLQVVGPA
jgi:hypothetical protein